MKTLPAGWSTYIESNWRCFYVVHIVLQDSTNIDYATLDTTSLLAWNKAQGRLKQAGLGTASIRADVRQGGGLAQVSDFEFDILNHDNYWDDTLSAYSLTNAKVTIYRHMVEATPASLSDGLKVGTYIIVDWWYDREKIHIRCKIDETDHKDIPRIMLDEKAFSSLSIPDENNGKPVPMCWGEGYFEAFMCSKDDDPVIGPYPCTDGDSDSLEDTDNSPFLDGHVDKTLELIGGFGAGQANIIKTKDSADQVTIYDKFQEDPLTEDTIYQITDPEFVYIMSDEEIKAFLTFLGIETSYPLVYYRENNDNVILPITLFNSLNNSSPLSNYAGFQLKNGIIIRDNLKVFWPLPMTIITDDTGWTDSDKAIDWDETTRAYQTIPGTGAANFCYGEILKAKMTSNYRSMIGEWDKLYFYVIIQIVSADTGYHGRVEIDTYNLAGTKIAADNSEAINDDSGNVYLNNIHKYLIDSPIGLGFPDGANIILIDIDNTTEDWDTLISNREFWIRPYAGAVTTGEDFYFYINEIGLMLEKSLPINTGTKFMVHAKGRMFGGTWGGRKTAANLIENPGDIVEKIIRDDLGNTTDIDTGAFDTLTGTDRSGWEMTYQIRNKINSLKEFEDIAYQGAFVYLMDHNGEHSVEALKLTGTPARTLNQNDVLCRGEGLKSTFKVDFSPLDYVVNEFFVHYDYKIETGEYQGLVFIKSPNESSYSADYVSTMNAGSDLHGNESTYWGYCHTSYDTYGFVKTKHIYLDKIADAVTAENFLAFMVKWLYLRKAEVSFYTQLQNCDIEFGDIITLTDKLREGDYFVYGIHEDLTNDEIYLEMREL